MQIPIRISTRRILLLDASEIFYLEGQRGDALVRTARKTLYRSARRLADWDRRLKGNGFVRIHRSYLVNLARVREIRLRSGDPNDWEVKLDPPVNAVLPIGRSYYSKLKELLGL